MAKPVLNSLSADVLVLGGGPAGVWAAFEAARAGASVILADKGYCGASGAAAASNNNIWYVPDSTQYERHFQERYHSGGGLSERAWTYAILSTTRRQLLLMGELGYRFPITEAGERNYGTLRGPDYLRFMRNQLRRAKVRILDHCPAHQLHLQDGRVAGAWGERLDGSRWSVSARATVIATGGCAFLSGVLGTNVCTGEAHLAAAEAGVRFSGMEFSNQYGMAANFSTVTKGLPFHFASYYQADGEEIDTGDEEPFVAVARASLKGPVYACFNKADAEVQRWLRSGQAIAFLPYDRMGIDPFRQRFELSLRLEGTVRGTGGIELQGLDCSTSVPGLYAAGDAASREPIVGGRSGGGSPNAAWALATGSLAGEAAARAALAETGRLEARPAPQEPLLGADPEFAMATIREHLWSVESNIFRTEASLSRGLAALDAAWRSSDSAAAGGPAGRRARAMLHLGRLAYHSALTRRDSVALHQRFDLPDEPAAAPYRLRIAGVEQLTTEAIRCPAP